MTKQKLINCALSLSLTLICSSVLAEDKPAAASAAPAASAAIGDTAFTMIIHMTAQPDKGDALIEFFRDCVAKTRKEPGCFLYHFNRDNKDPNHFILIETWADKASHEAHMQQKHTKDLLAGVKNYVVDGSVKADNYKPVSEPK
jgi:quinol monooxygenase YgiN